jgi:hypothetical protein
MPPLRGNRRFPRGNLLLTGHWHFAMKIHLKLAAASIAGLLVSSAALAAEIVPHQAMYRLALQDMKMEGWAETSNGTMEVRVLRDCFHYGIDRHIDFNIRYTDDRETHIVIEERLREAVEAQQYWYWSRTTLNGTAEQEAAQQDDGTIEMRLLGVQVKYNWPDDRRIEVDPAAIFPFDALKRQLDSLEAGALQPEFIVFDGLNKDDAYRAIYRPAQVTQVANPIIPDGNAELLDAPAWRFTTQYFLMGSESHTPARTITSKVHANGVVSETIIDIGPFAFKGTLAWLKGEPIPNC